jgi:hypothetical protein
MTLRCKARHRDVFLPKPLMVLNRSIAKYGSVSLFSSSCLPLCFSVASVVFVSLW